MADPYLRDDARGHIHVDSAERAMREAVTSAFRQYLHAVEQAVLDGNTAQALTAATDPDLDRWPPAHVWRRIVAQHILPTWRRLWRRAFGRFLSKQQRAKLDDNDYIAQQYDDATQRLTGAQWPDEVYNTVREQMQAGWAAGENLRQLRRRVRNVLGPDQWTGRSELVARSESLAALNGGAFRAGQARQQVFGETLFKRWLATHDQRVRPSHWAANGQTVEADEPFTVGGEHLQFPHDPTASPAQAANCRCVLTWHDSDEVSALREQYEQELPNRTDIEGNPIAADGAVTAVKGHMPGTLKRYWTHGKGAAKIRWGTKSDFYRCRRHLRKYVPPHMVNGLCSNLHKRALGVRPGQEGAKKADAGCCPAEDMTDEQIEEALAAMRDDPEIQQELEDHPEGDPQPDETPEPAPTSDDDTDQTGDDAQLWELPGEDEVDDDDLDDGDGNTVIARDFTPSGGPTAGKRKRAEKSRAAMKGGRFPIENGNDLRKAIMSLGRAGGGSRGRAAVKAHIMRRAKALGLTSRLPEAWTKKRTGPNKAASAATSGNAWYERVSEQVPNQPPASWFADPELSGPTKLRVTADGRVYGHIAAWDTEHASLPGVTARMFAADPLHRFHRHPVRTADGERVKTGPLATGGHASTDEHVGLTAAQSHYDDPTFVAADVVTGKDTHGIWASGSLRPGVSPFQVMLLDRYSISGDWRNGELVAACSVSVPGFHLDDDASVYALAADAGPNLPRLADHRPRAAFDPDGYASALVAAGVVTESEPAAARQLDGWELFRQFRQAQQTHESVEAARARVAAAAVEPLRRRVRATR